MHADLIGGRSGSECFVLFLELDSVSSPSETSSRKKARRNRSVRVRVYLHGS